MLITYSAGGLTRFNWVQWPRAGDATTQGGPLPALANMSEDTVKQDQTRGESSCLSWYKKIGPYLRKKQSSCELYQKENSMFENAPEILFLSESRAHKGLG